MLRKSLLVLGIAGLAMVGMGARCSGSVGNHHHTSVPRAQVPTAERGHAQDAARGHAPEAGHVHADECGHPFRDGAWIVLD